ncbi:MAG: spermine synthase [Methylococcales bacterium]|nr:spermine synthase [Methylococcales bacterium]
MYKYDGVVVHQSHDDEGVIEVVEKKGIRSLHFGSHSRQSSMLLSDPNQLHSLYAQAVMGLLLFNDNPKDILMIGLGGGTLTKYLLHQLSDCKIKVIEYRNSVLKVARSHFELPLDPRLKVKISCGGEYVAVQRKLTEQKHDLIVVDAFDHEGMALEVSNENFFDGCRSLLKDDGLLVINLWGTNKDLFQSVAWNIGRVFEWKVLFLPVRKRGNVIGFAFRENAPKYTMKELREKAKQLEQQYQINFPSFVQDFKRNNSSVLDNVIKK